MTLTHRNDVSIAEIVVYVPCLITAIFLMFRHGFSKSAGWYFLVIFCLARIIGPAMQLATISNPTSTALYTGIIILQSIGLSPLFLAALGLLSRLIESINRSHKTLVTTRVIKFVELVLLVALILGINGGVSATNNLEKNGGVYVVPTISKVANALFILSYVAIVATTILLSFSVKHAEAGEKRILIAIAISLPFMAVRLIYSIISAFAHSKTFNLLNGSLVVLVFVALIEEFVIVVVYEVTGLTLNKVSQRQVDAEQLQDQHAHQLGDSNSSTQYKSPATNQNNAPQVYKQDNILLRIAKRTIIGKIVMRVSNRS